MAKKWQNKDDISKKRISPLGSPMFSIGGSAKKLAGTSSGSFAVYTMDGKRFLLPLAFLTNNVFLNLLKLSEEEFGISSNGPIMMPCESCLMSYIVLLVQRGLGKDSEHALLSVIASSCSSLYTSSTQEGQQLLSCN